MGKSKWELFKSYLPNGEKVPKRFRHFLRVNCHKTIMNPVAYITCSASGTALSYFIFMVGKHKIHPSTMYIERIPQIRRTHGTTLYMPTRPSRTPWTFPKWFPLLCRLHHTTRLSTIIQKQVIDVKDKQGSVTQFWSAVMLCLSLLITLIQQLNCT